MGSRDIKETGDPPAFGHPMLAQFGFEPTYVNLNHGSYGSLPLPVLRACEEISRKAEANPDRFYRSTYVPLLNTVRAKVAELIGADTDDCVVVFNATHGVNTVLRNLIWQKEDIIVKTSVTYPSVARTIQYITDVPPHPKYVPFQLNFPTTPSAIIDGFRAHLKSIPRQPDRKIVAVIDSISSTPGVLLPWKELVKICREEGVLSVVDAAHSIGQELDINLRETDPDFWISNCHKWLYAKRACAVLYVAKRNQDLIRTTLPTTSNYVSPTDPPGGPKPPNYPDQFMWAGTIDWAPYLSVSHALEFRQWVGGEHKINDYCHNLALSGGRRLAEILGTRVMDENGEFTANMVNVQLPLNADGSDKVMSNIMRRLDGKNVNGKPYYHNGKWWVRCSAQIFNEVGDFEVLGEALLEICRGNLDG
ncbi:PLP-dependent transferase [Fomitiporia mediterranea MF3/22]|uniref:PLP-dependent transferase n=1 Tax=Fomitiporia mediterranea (strain MF3/22) TaxID=694068 RepID=UPI000440888A|nr:PLP-dependent transferase [Fomitiporia mediterranea MF3/22]EJD06673.1 PLP-dependent transferase [Fomitiporia mediterranea MF3/22]